jgi:hypothetical protein
MPANIDVKAPKKFIMNLSGINPGTTSRGTKLTKIVPEDMIKFEVINPMPYNIRINTLLFGFFEIPNDQKKNIALSSHGMAVWNIPNKNAGKKMIKYSCIGF